MVYMQKHMCHGVHVKVTGQFCGVGSPWPSLEALGIELRSFGLDSKHLYH